MWRIEALTAEIVAEIDTLVGAPVDGWDFEAIEVAARREALRVAGRAIARHFNAGHSDHTGPTVPCRCGGQARYAGRHAKTFTSALEDLCLERAYYHCDRCGSGFCPREVKLVTVWSAEGRDKEGVPVRDDGSNTYIAAKQFPDATPIVDRFHANEHLSAAAKAIDGPDADLHEEWAHLRCTDLIVTPCAAASSMPPDSAPHTAV